MVKDESMRQNEWKIVVVLLFFPQKNKYMNAVVCFRGAAKNAFYLKKIGVTHVLNTAEGKRTGLVDTNEDYYYPYGIKYKGLKLLDVAQTNIAVHFTDVAQYIDEALSSGGRKPFKILRRKTFSLFYDFAGICITSVLF